MNEQSLPCHLAQDSKYQLAMKPSLLECLSDGGEKRIVFDKERNQDLRSLTMTNNSNLMKWTNLSLKTSSLGCLLDSSGTMKRKIGSSSNSLTVRSPLGIDNKKLGRTFIKVSSIGQDDLLSLIWNGNKSSRTSSMISSLSQDWGIAYNAFADAILYIWPYRLCKLTRYKRHINGLFWILQEREYPQIVEYD